MRRLFFFSLVFLAVASFLSLDISVVNGLECYNGAERAGICFPITTGLSRAPVYDILFNLVWWLLAILSFIGIIAFVISGMQYLLAFGNEETVKTAKNSMKYSIIGMVVALSGWVIIMAVDQALRGNPFF